MSCVSIRFLSICMALLGLGLRLQASSAIIDGIVEKLNGDRIAIRVSHTPYSSISSASKLMTHKDGSYELRWENLSEYFTYYIDEVPVTLEQMKAFLRPGMQVCMMENRKREYFLYVSARGMGNQLGHLKSIDGNQLILEREQKGWQKDGGVHAMSEGRHAGGKDSTGKGEIVFTTEYYPNRETEIRLEADAVVLREGKRIPWQEAELSADQGPIRQRNSYVYQAARPQMRVELIPEGWGDWANLVTDLDTGGTGWGGREIRHQYLAIATGDKIVQKEFNTRPVEQGGEKLKQTKGFDSYLLAGVWNGQEDGVMWTPIYHKGQSVIVDGFYTTYISHWEEGFVKPGRIMVCFQRRARITPDRFAISSEAPQLWGVIQEINGRELLVEAPAMEGLPPMGPQRIQLEEDAAFFHLGQPVDAAEVLKVGSLIKIYPKRPQTLVENGG